jgi:hypothetical protein
MRINSSGNVGIGNSSPASLVSGGDGPVLSIGGTDSTLTTGHKTGSLSFITNDSSFTNVYSDGIASEIVSVSDTDFGAAYSLAFYTATTTNSDRAERLRIDSFGTSSPAQALHVNSGSTNEVARFESTDSTAYLSIMDNSTSSSLQGIGSTGNYLLFYSNAAERMRIDNNGNLLVGTTDVDHYATSTNQGMSFRADSGGLIASTRSDNYSGVFNRIGTDGDILNFRKDGSTVGSISSSDSGQTLSLEGGGTSGVRINASNASGYIRFRTAGSERMRIDSSGSLIIGATTGTGQYSGTGSNGMAVNSAGQAGQYVTIQNETDSNIYLTKKSGWTNNRFITFDANNTGVGNIVYNSGYLKINSGNTSFGSGIEFHNLKALPVGANGASSNGTVNLGEDTRRWKDLYLSGGVYLGGTGSANKLDDYEEGTFTPTMEFGGSSTGVTYQYQEGVYTKVGRLVTCFIRIKLSSNGSLSGSAQIESLPFTVGDLLTTTAYQGGFHMVNVSNAAGAQEGFTAIPNEGTTGLVIGRIADSSGNSAFTASASQITNTFDFRLTVTYMVA